MQCASICKKLLPNVRPGLGTSNEGSHCARVESKSIYGRT